MLAGGKIDRSDADLLTVADHPEQVADQVIACTTGTCEHDAHVAHAAARAAEE